MPLFSGLCCVPCLHKMQRCEENGTQRAGLLGINVVIRGSLPVIAVQESGGVIV